jgi:hypothetical protein
MSVLDASPTVLNVATLTTGSSGKTIPLTPGKK